MGISIKSNNANTFKIRREIVTKNMSDEGEPALELNMAHFKVPS